jgi:trehalose synthase
MMCQIARFDTYNDPMGVLEAYQIAKSKVPDLQLVLVALMIAETAEGWSYFERCAQRIAEDPDFHLLSELNGVGNTEINILQRAAKVVVQKSVKRGFGLGIAEALWKARPVIAGRVAGFPVQVTDNVDGFLVDTPEECAEKTIYLLNHPRVASRVGQAGKEYVRQNHLITRYLRDYLQLLNSF